MKFIHARFRIYDQMQNVQFIRTLKKLRITLQQFSLCAHMCNGDYLDYDLNINLIWMVRLARINFLWNLLVHSTLFTFFPKHSHREQDFSTSFFLTTQLNQWFNFRCTYCTRNIQLLIIRIHTNKMLQYKQN